MARPKKDAFWKKIINSLDVEDLTEGTTAPPEELSTHKSEQIDEEDDRKVIVQKIITEAYIYSDLNKNTFLPQAIQQFTPMGEMTRAQFFELVRNRRKELKSKE